ncbi:transposase [Xanthomonas euvesicatoria]|uniref:transposase n=1 Tax=Xanthomonas euvesicatoria TaxID=456327 RepID=UPI001E400777|nr:transposase [Xanthomonas euvesicatoria]
MARLPRIDLPGIPQHIVQRGNNRLPCFLDDGDRLRYLHLIHEALHATGCQLHAYVLMDNHVHLLVTPPAAGRIGQLMQRLGRNYVALLMAATGARARCGKAGTRHVLWTVRTTSFAAIATLSSIRCVLA